jgi:4-hydroxy-3-methylbut-2-en-1-yl diphosphate synthase IspG/GcpE
MRAYFDDGTIITCPRCAFTKENVENIQSNLSDEYKHMNLKMMEAC